MVTAEGEETLVLRLTRRVAAGPGDRFVLRRPSPDTTVGGGRVLDPLPPSGPSRRHSSLESVLALANAATPIEVARALVGLHGAVPVARIQRDPVGDPGADTPSPPGVPLAGWCLAPAIAAALRDEARSIVRLAHEADPDASGVPLAELRAVLVARLRQRVTIGRDDAAAVTTALVDGLVRDGTLARDAERVGDPARGAGLPPRTIAAMDRLESLLSAAAPPSLAEAVRVSGCPPEGIRALDLAGRLVRVDADLAWSGVTYRRLAALAIRLAGEGPLTPAAYRDATGTSRKYALAVLEDLGRRGVLRRTETGHVPGPRSPRTGGAPLLTGSDV
jgi:selenocysteine-specific elongation factor